MKPIVCHLPDDRAFAEGLALALNAQHAALDVHRLTGGESLVRLHVDAADRTVVVVCSLAHPDSKTLSLLFAAAAAREVGASSVVLVAPYLAYFRRDRTLPRAEAASGACRSYAKLLSMAFDALVTVDPPSNRKPSLDDVYGVPTRAVQVAPAIGSWAAANVDEPMFVGVDAQDEQWVAEVAYRAGAPYTVLQGACGRDPPDLAALTGHQPVLLGGAIVTARTMIRAVGNIRRHGLPAPVCIAVHALFEPGAYEVLLVSGPARIATCDTVPHASNQISVVDATARALEELLAGQT